MNNPVLYSCPAAGELSSIAPPLERHAICSSAFPANGGDGTNYISVVQFRIGFCYLRCCDFPSALHTPTPKYCFTLSVARGFHIAMVLFVFKSFVNLFSVHFLSLLKRCP